MQQTISRMLCESAGASSSSYCSKCVQSRTREGLQDECGVSWTCSNLRLQVFLLSQTNPWQLLYLKLHYMRNHILCGALYSGSGL